VATLLDLVLGAIRAHLDPVGDKARLLGRCLLLESEPLSWPL
jgi:hypothetical protein